MKINVRLKARKFIYIKLKTEIKSLEVFNLENFVKDPKTTKIYKYSENNFITAAFCGKSDLIAISLNNCQIILWNAEKNIYPK